MDRVRLLHPHAGPCHPTNSTPTGNVRVSHRRAMTSKLRPYGRNGAISRRRTRLQTQQPFRVWYSAGAYRAIMPQIEMHHENTIQRIIDIRHDDGPCSGRLFRTFWWIRIGKAAPKLASRGPIQGVSLRKTPAQFRFADVRGRNPDVRIVARSSSASRRFAHWRH